MARCRRCHTAQQQEGKEESDIEDKVYIGESSRSCTTRSAVHFTDYRQEMKRGQKKERKDEDAEQNDNEEGSLLSSWMADHTRQEHKGEMSEDVRKDYKFCVTGTFMKPLHRQVDEHLRMEKAECTGKAKVGRDAWKVEKALLNRKEESWSPKAAVYSSVYCGQSQSQPRIRTGGGPK